LKSFIYPIHLTGLFPTYDWYQVLRFVEPDSVRDWLSSVLGEEAKELMTRWQAEMEDALQSQFAQQVVEIEKPSESLLPQIVAWAQASAGRDYLGTTSFPRYQISPYPQTVFPETAVIS
jgi:beta-galactosidase GanA